MSKSQTGINIFNFIKTLEYDNSVLKDQIVLYLNYMDFFKITQTKYLAKLVGKTDSLKKEIDAEIVDDLEPPDPPVSVKEPYMELTVETSNPPNTPVVSTDEDDDEDGSYLELTSPTRMFDALSETSEISLTDSQGSKGSKGSEKKNEISAPENVGEKTVKKKGRPRTKNVAKTKNAKKDEATDSKGSEGREGRSAPETESSAPDTESSESFGLTIDQIEEHVNGTI
jgi:hypothetical protein